jgi:hypothetical protein
VIGASGTNGFQPSLTFSDWTPCPSLARLDGGTLPYLFIRTYLAGPFNMRIPVPFNTSPYGGQWWDTYANGRVLRTISMSGDQATTPGTVSSFSHNVYRTPIFAVQFMSEARGLTVAVFGDSLYQGYGGSGYQNDPFDIAVAALSTPSFPVSIIKGAYGGSQSYNFPINGYAWCKAMQPDVVFMKGESPNDSQTLAATWSASIAKMFAFAEWCTRQGMVPVLNTAVPWTYTGTEEGYRQAYNTAIRSSNFLYLDMDAILRDPANTQNILPAYLNTTTAPLHYNDAGSAVLSSQGVAPILSKIMAARPGR